MSKYIDADKLKAEIDRIEEEARKVRVSGTDKEAIGADGKIKLCLKLKSLIDSLPQEQQEVDLKKEIRSMWKKCKPTDEGMGVESAYMHIEAFDIIARHFYELGTSKNK